MKKVILVVEDERALLEAIKAKLEKSGFEVVSSRSVEGALTLLKDEVGIDAIWLDHYLLGKENGLDLVAKIKEENSPWKKIPIFVVSNTATPDKIRSYIELGVEKYFTKSNYRMEQIITDIKASFEREAV